MANNSYKPFLFILLSILTQNTFCMQYEPVSIENCGSSCYMNAALQCLSTVPELSHLLMHKYNCYKDNSLSKQYIELVDLITLSQLQNAVLKQEDGLLSSIALERENPSLESFFFAIGYELSQEIQKPEDAQQFLMVLLRKITDEDLIDKALVGAASKEKLDELIAVKNTLAQVFDIILSSSISPLYQHTEHAQKKQSKEYMLSLEIPEDSTNLKQCLDSFFAPELIEAGSENIAAIKQIFLQNAPEVLLIHLKRFGWDKVTQSAHKKFDNIAIPVDDLDMQQYLKHTDIKNTKYDLSGIVAHCGNALDGHYIAYVKTVAQNGQLPTWFVCDDSFIRALNQEEVSLLEAQGYIDQNYTPYILFYKKK